MQADRLKADTIALSASTICFLRRTNCRPVVLSASIYRSWIGKEFVCRMVANQRRATQPLVSVSRIAALQLMKRVSGHRRHFVGDHFCESNKVKTWTDKKMLINSKSGQPEKNIVAANVWKLFLKFMFKLFNLCYFFKNRWRWLNCVQCVAPLKAKSSARSL